MKSYESMVLNKTGVFPATVAKNASSGLATDGTEYIAAWINEDWGFWQALLTAAQMTPNGIAEAYNASQKMLAMRMVFGAPGELVFDDIPAAGSYGSVTISFPGTGPNGLQPAAYQYRRVIACMGQVLQVSLYTDLANAIYCGDANNATAVSGYRTTSAVSPSTNRSTSGTYFVMPDYRGLGVRGFDPGAAHDPAGASRGLLASIQLDALQTHVHDAGGHTHNTVMGTHTHDTVMGTHTHDTVMGTHTHDTVMGTHAHSTEIWGAGGAGPYCLYPAALETASAFSGSLTTSDVDLGTKTSNTTDLGTKTSNTTDLGTITSNTTDLGTKISSAASGNTGSPTTGRIDSETRMINATCNIGMRY